MSKKTHTKELSNKKPLNIGGVICSFIKRIYIIKHSMIFYFEDNEEKMRVETSFLGLKVMTKFYKKKQIVNHKITSNGLGKISFLTY